MLRHDYWNQWPEVILGADGENDGDQEGSDDDGDDDDEDDSNDDSDQDQQNKPPSAEDVAKLQEALAKERRLNKRLARDNTRFKNAQGTKQQQDLDELEQTKAREAEATTRAEKLAAGLLKRDIDTAIKEAARELKFLDVTDAIDGVDRSAIVFDQDDEDPTDIDIDLATVQAAVKKLSTKKPHFISRGTDDGEPSGSGFGGTKKTKKTTEDALKELYPSL